MQFRYVMVNGCVEKMRVMTNRPYPQSVGITDVRHYTPGMRCLVCSLGPRNDALAKDTLAASPNLKLPETLYLENGQFYELYMQQARRGTTWIDRMSHVKLENVDGRVVNLRWEGPDLVGELHFKDPEGLWAKKLDYLAIKLRTRGQMEGNRKGSVMTVEEIIGGIIEPAVHGYQPLSVKNELRDCVVVPLSHYNTLLHMARCAEADGYPDGTAKGIEQSVRCRNQELFEDTQRAILAAKAHAARMRRRFKAMQHLCSTGGYLYVPRAALSERHGLPALGNIPRGIQVRLARMKLIRQEGHQFHPELDFTAILGEGTLRRLYPFQRFGTHMFYLDPECTKLAFDEDSDGDY